MKKILTLIICLTFILLIPRNYVRADKNKSYKTSSNIEFDANEVVVYMSDFENIEFKTEQEFIDYIYLIGYNRVESVDSSNYSQYTVFGHKLTADEILYFGTHISEISAIAYYSEMAVSKTYQIYGTTADDSKANSFQHAYWVMLLYFDVSKECAKKEPYAHEQYKENDEMSKYMDLYNDNAAYDACSSVTDVSDKLLAEQAKSLQENGKLIYIKRDYTYVSTKTIYSNGKVVLEYTTKDFYCYSNSNTPYGVPTTVIKRVKYELMEGSIMVE